MDKHSPTPWRVSESPNGGGGYFIEHAGGYYVADVFHEADANIIVEAVNERDRLRDLVRRLADIVRHDCDERAMAVTREAYAALGEEVPE